MGSTPKISKNLEDFRIEELAVASSNSLPVWAKRHRIIIVTIIAIILILLGVGWLWNRSGYRPSAANTKSGLKEATFSPFANDINDDPHIIQVATNKELSSELKFLLDSYEKADEAVRKGNHLALLQRAEILAQLHLFAEAKEDCFQYRIDTGDRDKVATTKANTILAKIDADVNVVSSNLKSPYDQMEALVEQYLAAYENEDYTAVSDLLARMQILATEMTRVGEQWGNAMVTYYQQLPKEYVVPLHKARVTSAKIESLSATEGFEERLKQLKQVKKIFLQFNADVEIPHIDFLIGKYTNRAGDLNLARQIIDENINSTYGNKYIFWQAKFLYLRSVNLAVQSVFSQALSAIKDSLRITKSLGASTFYISLLSYSASLHETIGENVEALEKAYQTLKSSSIQKEPTPQMLHVFAMSAFKLGYPKVALRSLKYAYKVAQTRSDIPSMAISYGFQGLILSTTSSQQDAEASFTKALELLEKIEDKIARARIEFSIRGYYAKLKYQMKDFSSAETNYTLAIELAKQANINQLFILSELHKGLGECLVERDKARAVMEFDLALQLSQQARANLEERSNLNIFSATAKTCEEQLQLLIKS